MKKTFVVCAVPFLLLVGCGDNPTPPGDENVETGPEDTLPEIHNDDGDAKWIWTEHPDTGERVWCIWLKEGYGGGLDCLGIPQGQR